MGSSPVTIKGLILAHYKYLHDKNDPAFNFALVSEVDLSLPVNERFNLNNLDSFVSFSVGDETFLKVFISWSFYQDSSEKDSTLIPIPDFTLEKLDGQILGKEKSVDLVENWVNRKLYLQPSQLYLIIEQMRGYFRRNYFISTLKGGYHRLNDEQALWYKNPEVAFFSSAPEIFVFHTFMIIKTPGVMLSSGPLSELKLQIKVEFFYENPEVLKTITSQTLFPPEALEIFAGAELGKIAIEENTKEFSARIQREVESLTQSYIYRQKLAHLTLYTFAARFPDNIIEIGLRSITFYIELKLSDWSHGSAQGDSTDSADRFEKKKAIVHIIIPETFPQSGLIIEFHFTSLPHISKADRILTAPCPKLVSPDQRFADQVTDIAVQAIFSELTHPNL